MRILEQLVRAAHEARSEGLVVSTSGNISHRVDASTIAISAARTRLGRLAAEEIVAVDLASGEHRANAWPEVPGARPSRETPMHLAVYRAYADVQCVLHFQSLAGTLLACRAGAPPDLSIIPEFPVYVRAVRKAPYAPPGTAALGERVVEALSEEARPLVLLESHGQLVTGRSLDEAVERAVFFELAARLVVLAETREPLRRFGDAERALLESYAR